MTEQDLLSLEIRDGESGSSFRVAVRPHAGRDRIAGVRSGALRVEVAAPAEKGRANEAVLGLVASALGIRGRDIEIVRGASSREKALRVRGLGAGALRRLMGRLLDSSERSA